MSEKVCSKTSVKRCEIIFIEAERLQADKAKVASKSFICDEYSDFLLLYEVAKDGTVPDTSTVQFYVRFHDRKDKIYNYEDGAFGLLLEEESSVPCLRAFRGRCIGREMSVKAVASGSLSTSNYFTVGARVQFFKEVMEE